MQINNPWTVAGEIEPGHEARQFYASLIYLAVYDALAITAGNVRAFGVSHANLKRPNQAKNCCNRQRIDVQLWIASSDFHHYCGILGLDGERYAQYIHKILQGDPEAIKRYHEATEEVGVFRMEVRNGKKPKASSAS